MFEYVSRSEYQPVRKYVESVIKKVQKEFRNRGILTFRFYLIGSAGKRHLITREVGGNKGFDLDYNFEIQKYNPKYHDPKTLKLLFMEPLISILTMVTIVVRIQHLFSLLKKLTRNNPKLFIALILQLWKMSMIMKID